MTYVQTRGVRVTAVTLARARGGFEHELRSSGLVVRTLKPRSLLRRVVELRSIAYEVEADLIYSSLFEADLVGRLACVGTGVPVVSSLVNTSHDPVRLHDPNIKRWRLKAVRLIDAWSGRHLVTHFHAISQTTKDAAIQELGFAPDKISVVTRGRDAAAQGEPSPERKQRVRRANGLSDDDVVFINVGRHEFQKGQAVLVDAFALIGQSHPEATLLIAGREGNLTSELLLSIASAPNGDRIHVLGHRADIPDLLAGADVFVFPSLYEGLGGAVIEAMALGLPIIASDIPAMRELVARGADITRVPPSSRELAEAMANMIEDPTRTRSGMRNREMFLTDHQLEKSNEQLFGLLKSVAGSGSRG